MPKHHRYSCARAAAAACIATLLGASGAAHAVTLVQPGFQDGNQIEPSVWNVLNALLGGGAALTQADVNTVGANIGGVNGLSRVDDALDGFYQDGNVPVGVVGLFFGNPNINAPFAGDEHDLYFENETQGTPAVQVVDFTTVLNPISVGPGELFSLTSVRGNLAFDGSQDNTSIQIASSIPSENVAAGVTTNDRLVTFGIDIAQISTLNGLDDNTINLAALASPNGSGIAYIHFFDTGLDADYQDAVYLTVNARALPTPGGVALLAAGGLLAVRRRR